MVVRARLHAAAGEPGWFIRASKMTATLTTIPRITTKPSRGRLVMEHVNKIFTNGRIHTLRDISLTCEAGEFVVVVGPSGCGKSTLLNIAAGMLRPDSGTVTLDGK